MKKYNLLFEVLLLIVILIMLLFYQCSLTMTTTKIRVVVKQPVDSLQVTDTSITFRRFTPDSKK